MATKLELNRTYVVRNNPHRHLNGLEVVIVGFDHMLLHGKPITVPVVVDEGDAEFVSYYMEPQFLFEV